MTDTLTGRPASPAETPRPAGRPGRLRRTWDRSWWAWAMVIPVVIVLAVLVAYPLAQGVLFSFTNADESNVAKSIGANQIPATWDFVGLDNYTKVLSGEDGAFYRVLRQTLVWTVVGVFFHYTLGLLLAVMLNRPMRFRAFYRVMLIVPWAVPAFVSAFAWRYMFNTEYGVINYFLGKVGIEPVAWLETGDMAFAAAIWVNIWIGVPFMMVAILGGLQSIPNELYEAAEVDGATALQRFRNITLPGLRTISTTVILLGTIWTFNQFAILYLMTGNTFTEAQILVTWAFRITFTGIRDYALGATYGVIILSILIVYAGVYRRVLRTEKGEW